MCKHYTVRQKQYKKYGYCLLNSEWNPICNGCKDKDYKEYKPIKRSNKPIKSYSKKRAKAERERTSIFTNDLDHCIEDKRHTSHIDKHEVFDGKNRLKSIKYGLVIPVCRNCHEDEIIVKKWQVIGRQAFIKEHGEELFTKEFQTRKGIKE